MVSRQSASDKRLKARAEYVKNYLTALKSVYLSFQQLFGFLSILFWSQAALSVLALLVVLAYSGPVGAIPTAALFLNLMTVAWFGKLAKDFVTLQAEKAEQDLDYQMTTDQELAMTNEELLRRARKRVEGMVNKITIGGSSFGPIAVAQGSNAQVSQSTAQEIKTKQEGLALLKAYCDEAQNKEASSCVDKIIKEAEKGMPDKNTVFDAWTKIVSLLPAVSQIASIANTIRLMLG